MSTVNREVPTPASDRPTPPVPTIRIFGPGYPACVSVGCLSTRGSSAIGIDANPQKTEFTAAGKAPVVEERIGELTAEQVTSGWPTVSADPAQAVRDSDLAIVCVGTSSAPNGASFTDDLERATEEIGAALAGRDDWHVVVRRSTMVPGTCEGVLIPILEQQSGKRAGVDFGVYLDREFLPEGTSVWDFLDRRKMVVGKSDARSGDPVMSLYDDLLGLAFGSRSRSWR